MSDRLNTPFVDLDTCFRECAGDISDYLQHCGYQAYARKNVDVIQINRHRIILERVAGRTFAQLLDQLVVHLVVHPLRLQRTSVLESIEDLLECVPGFGAEVGDDGSLVDVRGRYHPGWCAPRVASSTPAEITLVFDALFSGQLLGAEALHRMLTFVPLPGLREPRW